MKIVAHTKCIRCGRVISVTEQFETETGSAYKKKNEDCRYIDKWGFERNICKGCMR